MAIVVETRVPSASKAEFDRFDASIEVSMMQAGGPPAGLMAHLVRPSGEGFLICNVWRTEVEMRAFYDEVVLSRLNEAGLEPDAPLIEPVWSFARP